MVNIKKGVLFVSLIFGVLFFSNVSASLTDGLIGYWPFNTDSEDYSPSGNYDLTYSVPNYISGVIGQGISTPGTSNLAYYPHRTADDSIFDVPSDQSLTVCAWAKKTTTIGDEVIVAKQDQSSPYNGWRFILIPSNECGPVANALSLDIIDGYSRRLVRAAISFPQGEWQYVCGVIDRATQKISIYQQGVDVTYTGGTGYCSRSISGVKGLNALRGLGVGVRDPGYIHNRFTGEIDEVAIWNRTLSDSEILELYNSGRGLSLLLPILNITSPLNGSYYNSSNITINFSSSDADFLWYNNGTGNSSIIDATQDFIDYFNSSDGRYDFTFYANKSSARLLALSTTFWIDTTVPLIEFSSQTKLNYFNSSVNSVFVNTSIVESNPSNITFNLYYHNSTIRNSSIYRLSSTLQNSSINWTNLADGVYYYNVTLCDRANNCNSTETRAITIDTTPPEVNLINYSPETNDSIDPFVLVTINANVTDRLSPINPVLLITYNDSDQINYTMEYVGGYYQYNLTLASTEQIYKFNIWSNDSLGNINQTSNKTLYSFWDCTWNISTTGVAYDLGSTGGWGEEVSLGNITISNTGDVNYSTNNCIINFAETPTGKSWQQLANGFSGTYITSDFSPTGGSPGLSYLSSNVDVTNLSIPAKQSRVLEIKGRFPISEDVLSENPSFTIASNINDTESGQNQVVITANMVVTPGAYLSTAIESPIIDPYLIYLTPGNYSFNAYVKDVVSGANGENNTAYNVSMNWTIPSSIIDLFEYSNLTLFSEVLNDTSKKYINITLNLTDSNLPSLNQNIYNLTVYAKGYQNSSGNLTPINHSGREIISDQLRIQFLCYSVPDGISIPACGSLDGDYVPPTTSSGGGSGGGGGAGGGKQEVSVAQFELVVGNISHFYLPITNKYPTLLKDLRISVSGPNSEYVEILNPTIAEIGSNSQKNISIKINAPAYFREGDYQLRFRIEGFVDANGTRSPYSESKLVTLFILDVSREQASEMLNQSEFMVSQLDSLGLSTRDLEKLLVEIRESFNQTRFSLLKSTFETLKLNYDSAVDALDILKQLKKDIAESELNGISVFESKKLMLLGEQALNRGAFIQALERLNEARLTYALETKGEFSLYHYIRNNPFQILGIILCISIIGYTGTITTYRQVLKRRLKLLKQEQVLLLGLMKLVQRECFELNRMSMEDYGSAMNQYEDRLQKSVEQEVRTETQLAHLGKFSGKAKALAQERDRLVDLIKSIQTRYLVRGGMETRIYHNMMQSYTKRLTELEEELTFLEAQEFMKKKRYNL